MRLSACRPLLNGVVTVKTRCSHLSEGLEQLDEMMTTIRHTLTEEAPPGLRDGGLLRPGVDEEVDRLRTVSTEGRHGLPRLSSDSGRSPDIPSLKVKNNRQVGWYIEVTQTHLDKVPETWRRKQQLTNGSRYTTEELVERRPAAHG